MKPFQGNTLIVWYSRTGRCEKIANYLKSILTADSERLRDKEDYSGYKGLAVCAAKAVFRRPTALAPTRYDPAFYDDVVLVSPIWAGKSCPAIRTYAAGHADKFSRVHLVACGGLSTQKGVRRELSHDYGIHLSRTLNVTIDDVESDIFKLRVRQFTADHYISPDTLQDPQSDADRNPDTHAESVQEANSDVKQQSGFTDRANETENQNGNTANCENVNPEKISGYACREPNADAENAAIDDRHIGANPDGFLSDQNRAHDKKPKYSVPVTNGKEALESIPDDQVILQILASDTQNVRNRSPYGADPYCTYPADSPSKKENNMNKNETSNNNNPTKTSNAEKANRGANACSNKANGNANANAEQSNNSRSAKSNGANTCSNKANGSANANAGQSNNSRSAKSNGANACSNKANGNANANAEQSNNYRSAKSNGANACSNKANGSANAKQQSANGKSRSSVSASHTETSNSRSKSSN